MFINTTIQNANNNANNIVNYLFVIVKQAVVVVIF